MPTVTFMPADITAEYRDGESIFDVGQRLEVAIETSCVGQGTCGLCRVRVLAGEEFLNPYGEIDEKHLGNVYYLTKVRLSCQARPSGGDVVVELAPSKSSKKTAASKRAATPFPTR